MANPGADLSKLSMRELMLKFESLGQNCEFGIAQRAHKAEPLGLFRWGATSISRLVSALEARLEGLAAPEAVKIRLAAGEYMADETKYRITYHTFVRDGEVDPQALHEREYKRLQYLTTKLLDDLEDAKKVFVYQRGDALSEDEIAPLYRALQNFGPNKLLWVVPMDAQHPCGTVEWIGSGFLRGYIDHFADPARVPATTSVQSWSSICSNAWRLLAERGP